MDLWLWVALAGLSCVLLFLVIKVILLRRSALRLSKELTYRLTHETNTLLDIPSRDRAMRLLAAGLNDQLALLRGERLRFQQGDLALRVAVTHISHDLRTPLTAIYGYLDLLETTTDPQEIRRYLEQIRNRTEAMTGLAEELFRYLVTAFPPDSKAEETDLRRALEEALLSFYGAFSQKDIKPAILLPDQRVIRLLNPALLNRVFDNILSNVLKYSDGDFRVDMDEEGRIVFTNRASSLDPVKTGQLFDRFYTVENAERSTGLGLSIAKQLTKQMGGRIEATYRQGNLIITLFFPNNSL